MGYSALNVLTEVETKMEYSFSPSRPSGKWRETYVVSFYRRGQYVGKSVTKGGVRWVAYGTDGVVSYNGKVPGEPWM
jgi:hypothetical protein